MSDGGMREDTLRAALTELLIRTGAQAAHLLDSRDGTVPARVGAVTDDVATLFRLAADAAAAAAEDGGLTDLMLSTPRSVHLFREVVSGSFVHLRLDGDRAAPAAARQELAGLALDDTVRAALGGGGGRTGMVPPPVGPGPHTGGQPALAALAGGGPRRRRTGRLAALALGPVTALPTRDRSAPALRPRPSPTKRPAVPAVLEQSWANDATTLRRLLTALRRHDEGPH
jgi:hypothetical protein